MQLKRVGIQLEDGTAYIFDEPAIESVTIEALSRPEDMFWDHGMPRIASRPHYTRVTLSVIVERWTVRSNEDEPVILGLTAGGE